MLGTSSRRRATGREHHPERGCRSTALISARGKLAGEERSSSIETIEHIQTFIKPLYRPTKSVVDRM